MTINYLYTLSLHDALPILTVLENLLVAQHQRINTSLIAGLLKSASYRRSEEQALERAVQWLEYMELRPYANREAGNLAYGHQRRLENARCLLTNSQGVPVAAH